MTQLRGEAKSRFVSGMFSRIAPRYDLLNTVMTGGMHRRWRQKASQLIADGLSGTALDVASGTGDFAFALLRDPSLKQVVTIDFAAGMLDVAKSKSLHRGLDQKIALVRGDALHLPFPNNTFDYATSGFGLRNMVDISQSLREMARVVRPGGRVAILEITPVHGPVLWRWLFRRYFFLVTPVLGTLLARDRRAYTYLPHSVDSFPTAHELKELMTAAGLTQVCYQYMGLGTVALHIGVA